MMTSFLTFLAVAWIVYMVAGVLCFKANGLPVCPKPHAIYTTLVAFVWLAWRLLQ